jgi:hypothetical protein
MSVNRTFGDLVCKAVLHIWSVKAAALRVKRLWSAARITITTTRRSILTSHQMQLLKCQLNVGLLGNSVLIGKLCMKLLGDDLEFQTSLTIWCSLRSESTLRSTKRILHSAARNCKGGGTIKQHVRKTCTGTYARHQNGVIWC